MCGSQPFLTPRWLQNRDILEALGNPGGNPPYRPLQASEWPTEPSKSYFQ